MKFEFSLPPSTSEQTELKKLGFSDSDFEPANAIKLSSDPVPLASLKESLQCSICHNIMKEPVISKVCFHSFCKDCIFNLLSNEPEKVCPLCQYPIYSCKNLHPNSLLQQIIDKLTPSADFTPLPKKRQARQPSVEVQLIKDPLDDNIRQVPYSFIHLPPSLKFSSLLKVVKHQLPESNPKRLFLDGDTLDLQLTLRDLAAEEDFLQIYYSSI